MCNFISFARFILRSWRWQNGIFALQRDSLSIGSLTRSVYISFSVREAFSHRNVPLPLCFRKKKKALRALSIRFDSVRSYIISVSILPLLDSGFPYL